MPNNRDLDLELIRRLKAKIEELNELLLVAYQQSLRVSLSLDSLRLGNSPADRSTEGMHIPAGEEYIKIRLIVWSLTYLELR